MIQFFKLSKTSLDLCREEIGRGLAAGAVTVVTNREFLALGLTAGYFGPDSRGTASFEMRPYPDLDPSASLGRFIEYLDTAWERLSE
jgi:hypothetical protein